MKFLQTILERRRAQRRAEHVVSELSEKADIDLLDDASAFSATGKRWYEYKKPDRYRLLVEVAQQQEFRQRNLADELGIDHLLRWERHDQIIREDPWPWRYGTYYIAIEKKTGKPLFTDADLEALARAD